ncbi:Bacterial SH3 domain protein [Shimia sp. SK013]|uniref:SH3 domain-containing protein n=1 Tax=Shimia sp. SK013 TaxID=1389006 RepID=UPI0006CD97AC|nr:Bacterial SH3 domain protein [Shimia sp. SK013]
MSLRRWAIVLGIALVGLANIDTDETDGTKSKPAAPSKVAAPKPKKHLTLYVTGSVVNVRSGPSTAYEKLFQLHKGHAVKELETRDGWTKLSSRNRSGWMSKKYLSPNKPPSTAANSAKKRASQCHPNYSGACVPIASDVDCAGGSGNGPAYVQGPVHVTGRDVYRLDRDKDGIGCE